MKRIAGLLLISNAFFCAFSQSVESPLNDWENPAVFEIGQNAPHAFHVPYETAMEAIRDMPQKCENYQLLNGQWKFKWVETPQQVPEDFWKPEFETGSWDEIKVPSNWQMEAYGHPKFRNIALSFENNPPQISDYYNPCGCYKRKFTILENWEDKEVMLRFEGIKSASYVWVNGQKVGYNQGGFEPAEFNITPFLEKGENDVAVQVMRFSDGSYLENQDMWRLSGIYRDVKLYAQPKTYIHDYYVVSDFDEDYKNATLTVETVIQNRLPKAEAGEVIVDVYDLEGRSILKDGALQKKFMVDSMGNSKVQLSTEVIDPPQWSAEFPHLFILLVQLKNSSGKVTEAFTQKIGFREVEYTDNILTVNGVPVKLNGVNSHMHHPEHGQAVPLETLKQDLVLMKQHNINCVRTSHYPPTPEYLALADELGIYIVDEVGNEAHRNLQLSENPQWAEMYRDRTSKLVYRDRNHPSVIIWSAGNESGRGQNINEVIKTGKAIDFSRPVWMYGGNTFASNAADVVGPRYWAPVDYKNLAQGKVLPANDRRASFMDEYLAATGNGMGGMDEYWEYIWKYPRLTGGAIWDWVSPGIKTPRWILPDLSPQKNHGQILGRPVFQQGVYGWGLEFSGHDDWVEFYRHPSLDITKHLTIDFWVKPSRILQPNVFIAKGAHGYGIQMADAQTLEFYVYTDKRVAATVKVDSGFYENWQHITGRYNGNNLQLFVNNKRIANVACRGSICDTPFPLCIGRNAETQDMGEQTGRMSKMVIDDVRVFNKAVNANNIEDEKDGLVLHLNFEEDEKVGDFYAVGLGGRTYGVVWPDRRLQPEINQIKRSGQPVKVEALDIENGVLKVTNRHHFKNLNKLQGYWQIKVDGKTSQRGFFNAELQAGESGEITIDYRRPLIQSTSECLLEVSFLLKEDTNWAKKGHEIAWEQLRVPTDFYFLDEEASNDKVNVSENESGISISGSNFSYKLDKKTGQLVSMKYKGAEYIEGGPALMVWRAPLANDIDPWGSNKYSTAYIAPGLGRSIDNQLRTLGMRDLVPEVEEYEWLQIKDDEVILKMDVFANSSQKPIKGSKQRFYASAFERKETWKFRADGSILLEQEIIPHGPMPEMLPKVGMQFLLPKSFNRVQWYGRGPFENYPDRKTGAKVGLYQSTADSMYVPYLIPQDYGNRCDVRWLKIETEAGNGLLIKGNEPLNFSLHKYTTDNLSRAMYSCQLIEADNTILNVDYEVSGVGATANRQLQKYRVRPDVKRYSVSITPY